MTGWLLRRIGQALLVVLVMTVIVFVGLHAIGNPVDILIGQDVDQIDRARIIAELGLDKPLWQQYLSFLNGAVHGNLGKSFVYNEPAIQLILQRLPATLELAFAALIIAVVIGVPLGLFAGLYPNHPVSRLLMTGSVVGFSLPTFWVGLMLIMAFSVSLGWLPASGRGETARLFGIEWSWLTVDGLRHLLLGLELGSTIAFAVVTESIFAWPGAGKLILDSINSLDRPVIVSYLIVVVCLFVSLNLIVDILYRMLDPRVRAADSAEAA